MGRVRNALAYVQVAGLAIAGLAVFAVLGFVFGWMFRSHWRTALESLSL